MVHVSVYCIAMSQSVALQAKFYVWKLKIITGAYATGVNRQDFKF